MITPRYVRTTRSFTLRLGSERTLVLRLSTLILSCFALSLSVWFGRYFSSEPIASVDLPGHIAVVERMVEHLTRLRVRFYDPAWFSGWPAFQFYAFFAHLLTALLALPLMLVSDEAVRLAAHVVLLACSALLPFSMYYAAVPIAEDAFKEHKEKLDEHRWLLAVIVCAMSFWFLNHDRQWFGIGAAALFNVGLFSQGLGWHFFLLHTGALLRLLRDGSRYLLPAALFFALLFLTHSLTAACSLFIAAVALCRFPERRILLLQTHALAFGLTAFWLLPFLFLAPDYLGQDIYRPAGDFLELFFRYPLYALGRTMSSWLHGSFSVLDVNNVYVMALAVSAVWSRRLLGSRMFNLLGLALIAGIVVFSSGFVATSLPVSFHYYRFFGYLFLLAALLLTIVPISWSALEKAPRLTQSLILVCCLLSLVSTVQLPHYERDNIAEHSGLEHLKTEQAVLEHLGNESEIGRVLFAYFSDYNKYTFLSAHYMESRLWKEHGIESINGLFIQSSLAYRMPIASASLLGIPGYHIPLLFTDRANISDRGKVRQLREFGVTHLVVGTEHISDRLRRLSAAPPRIYGPYAVLRIARDAPPKVEMVRKRVIGYLDVHGSLPFRFVEFYLYARESLSSRFELLKLERGARLPADLAGVVVNGARPGAETKDYFDTEGDRQGPPLLQLDHLDRYRLDHYSVWYQHNIELDAYNAAEDYLENKIRLPAMLFPLAGPEGEQPKKQPGFSWSKMHQRIKLENLIPGKLYRINYSYFPYWRSGDGTVFRGLGERIFFLPESAEGELSYSPLRHVPTVFGYLITVLAAVLLVRLDRSRLPEEEPDAAPSNGSPPDTAPVLEPPEGSASGGSTPGGEQSN